MIEQSREGTPTLSVTDEAQKKIYLHSRYDPLKESEVLKDKFIPDKFDALIILGSGLGYHLLELKGIKDKYRKIIIIDILMDIDKEIARNPFTDFLAKSQNIKFLTGISSSKIEEILNSEIDFGKIKGLDVIEHPASIRAFSAYYNEITKIIQQLINRKAGNIATQKAFGTLYLKNIFKNFNAFSSLYPVSAFFKAMKDYPAIIVASGPDMENCLQKIKANQKKFFIVAADSALNTLIQNNIMPDFFVSIDPQPYTFEHLFDVKSHNIIPILTISSTSLIISRYKESRALLSLNTHPVAQIIDDMFPDTTGHTDSKTGTVAGDAVMTAVEFGFSQIGLIGFDFSFSDYKIYPRGSAYQKRFMNSSTRFSPVETINFNYIMKSSKGYKYENKFTRKSFIRYKEAIEKLIKNSKNINNINDAGIPVRGADKINLNNFINNYCGVELNKPDIINKIFNKTRKTGEIISYKKIQDYILKKDVFDEIINVSIDINSNETKTRRLKALLEMI